MNSFGFKTLNYCKFRSNKAFIFAFLWKDTHQDWLVVDVVNKKFALKLVFTHQGELQGLGI